MREEKKEERENLGGNELLLCLNIPILWMKGIKVVLFCIVLKEFSACFGIWHFCCEQKINKK